jgi:hypothetical protein
MNLRSFHGKQAILLRKYPPARREFFLYPTYEFARKKDHLQRFQPQYRELVKDAVSSKQRKMMANAYISGRTNHGANQRCKIGHMSLSL